jgi:hypothetical protein
MMVLLPLQLRLASAQQVATNVTADGGNSTIESVTPDVGLVSEIFSSAVDEELPDQEYFDYAAAMGWTRLFNTSKSAPFLVCASGGRAGVEAMFTVIPAQRSIPLYSTENITCFAVHQPASTVANSSVSSDTPILYATPVPPMLKVARQLYDDINSGAMLNDTELPRIALRIVLSPGVGENSRMLLNTGRRIRSSLNNGAYKATILNDFLWTAIGSSSDISAPLARRAGLPPDVRLRVEGLLGRMDAWEAGQREAAVRTAFQEASSVNGSGNGSAPAGPPPVQLPPRGQEWLQAITPVLNGTITCPWGRLIVSMQSPYVRVDNLKGLVHAVSPSTGRSCLLTVVAFVVSLPEVLYIEEYPPVYTANQVAAAISQSDTDDSWPMYTWGLNGTGQVVQLADTGVNRSSCFFADPTGEVPTTDALTGAFDITRRKVVQYVAFSDNNDLNRGHGTHVAGEVVGRMLLG